MQRSAISIAIALAKVVGITSQTMATPSSGHRFGFCGLPVHSAG